MCCIELCDLAETNVSVTVKKILVYTKRIYQQAWGGGKAGRDADTPGEARDTYNRSGIRHITWVSRNSIQSKMLKK